MHMDFISILLKVLVSLAACYFLRNKSGRDILFMSIVAFTVCAIVSPTKSLDIFTASDISMIFVFYVLACILALFKFMRCKEPGEESRTLQSLKFAMALAVPFFSQYSTNSHVLHLTLSALAASLYVRKTDHFSAIAIIALSVLFFKEEGLISAINVVACYTVAAILFTFSSMNFKLTLGAVAIGAICDVILLLFGKDNNTLLYFLWMNAMFFSVPYIAADIENIRENKFIIAANVLSLGYLIGGLIGSVIAVVIAFVAFLLLRKATARREEKRDAYRIRKAALKKRLFVNIVSLVLKHNKGELQKSEAILTNFFLKKLNEDDARKLVCAIKTNLSEPDFCKLQLKSKGKRSRSSRKSVNVEKLSRSAAINFSQRDRKAIATLLFDLVTLSEETERKEALKMIRQIVYTPGFLSEKDLKLLMETYGEYLKEDSGYLFCSKRICDAFKTLHLNVDASFEEVRRAYRKLAHDCHPDKFELASEEERHAATERMKELNRAFADISKLHVKESEPQRLL